MMISVSIKRFFELLVEEIKDCPCWEKPDGMCKIAVVVHLKREVGMS